MKKIIILLFGIIAIGCKPRHEIDVEIRNNSKDTLIFVNPYTTSGFILPETQIHLSAILYEKPYPKKKFKCCPCESDFERFSIYPKSENRTLLKNPNENANWQKPTFKETSSSTKTISCIFEINDSDIQ
jgi:hypothetical protein